MTDVPADVEPRRIIKVRKQGSRREYFVEWTGWEAAYNSWTKDVSRPWHPCSQNPTKPRT